MQNVNVYKTNLDALKTREPELARLLHTRQFDEQRFVIGQAANQSPILGLRGNDGKTMPLINPSSPQDEADEWVRDLGEDALRHSHVMILGIGSGYRSLSFYHLSDENSFLWIVEPDLDILNAVLYSIDFTELFLSPRVRIIAGQPENYIARQLFTGVTANRTRTQGVTLAASPFARRFYAKYLTQLSNAIQQAIQTEKLSFHTETVQGREILNNVLDNLPYIINNAGINLLQSKAAGVPAFVISPGPSLEAALERMPDLRQRGYIIAVDTAYGILQRRNIPADIVVSLDFTKLNARHFELIDNDDAYLVSSVGVNNEIVKKYTGRSFFFTTGSNKVIQALPSIGALGELVATGSTAHIAFTLARLMGCSPIVLIGQDLAFDQGKMYTNGAMQNDLDIPGRKPENMLEVLSNSGATVLTNRLYKMFLDKLIEIIHSSAGYVINTSTQGAKIDGANCVPLHQVISDLPARYIDRQMLPCMFKQKRNIDKIAVQRDIDKLVSRSRHIQQHLIQLKDACESLPIKSAKFQTEFTAIYRQLQTLLQQDPHVFKLCTPLCPGSTISFMSQMGNAGLIKNGSESENQDIQKKSILFFKDFIDALELNIKSLSNASLSNTPK